MSTAAGSHASGAARHDAGPPSIRRVSLRDKVACLREPDIWPDRPAHVAVIETHLSWVFLTEHQVWKLKKPMRHAGADLRSLAARGRDCRRELVLNRRLAASVYREVVPLTCEPDGRLAIGGTGRTVDWLVRMRRLPAHRMLDHALAAHAVSIADIRAIAQRLAAFYHSLAPAPVSAAQYRLGFAALIDQNERDLTDPALLQDAAAVAALCERQRAMLARIGPRLDERVQAGRVVNGHGDLRPEHVCLAPPVEIIDCLTISDALRVLDSADELAFLALECERLGERAVGRALLRAWRDASGDQPDAALLHFYQSCRAAVRARLAALHLRERAFRGSARWRGRTREYLQLAHAHLQCCAWLVRASERRASTRLAQAGPDTTPAPPDSIRR